MEVQEESPRHTFVGRLSAYDPDIGENALIDYVITGMCVCVFLLLIKEKYNCQLSYNASF